MTAACASAVVGGAAEFAGCQRVVRSGEREIEELDLY